MTRIGLRRVVAAGWLPPSWTATGRLLAEPVPDLMRRVHDGVARGVGPIAKALADVIESAADMVPAKVIAGRVEIPLRTGAVGIAGGEGQRQGQQAQVKQFHRSGSFRLSLRSSRNKIQYSAVRSNARDHEWNFIRVALVAASLEA
jgi:hypothetical protein